jgi:hypothetical protein
MSFNICISNEGVWWGDKLETLKVSNRTSSYLKGVHYVHPYGAT